MAVKVFIDSTGELTKELREKYDIDYFPMTVSIDDRQIIASLDYDQGLSVKDFYDVMRGGKRIFTSQVPNPTFERIFEKALSAGNDILYIGCSNKLSASVKAAEVIAKKFREKYPQRRIEVVDALISGYGQGEMAIRASTLLKEGKSLDEVLAWIKENIQRFNQFGTVETLTYLKQAGRVTASSAFFGNLFAVKPILISNRAGENFAVSKVKGHKAALKEIARLTVEAGEDIENKTVYIVHADCIESAEFLKAEILKLAQPKEIYISSLGPIIGASTGPGTVVAYVFGKEVTI